MDRIQEILDDFRAADAPVKIAIGLAFFMLLGLVAMRLGGRSRR